MIFIIWMLFGFSVMRGVVVRTLQVPVVVETINYMVIWLFITVFMVCFLRFHGVFCYISLCFLRRF